MIPVFRPEAESEVLKARDWYEARAPGLGFEYARAVDAAVAAVLRNPETYPRVAHDCQKLRLRRFPYSLIYKASPGELLIVALFHQRRDPAAWHQRVSAP